MEGGGIPILTKKYIYVCFNDSNYSVSCYNYNSVWPYYILVIHIIIFVYIYRDQDCSKNSLQTNTEQKCDVVPWWKEKQTQLYCILCWKVVFQLCKWLAPLDVVSVLIPLAWPCSVFLHQCIQSQLTSHLHFTTVIPLYKPAVAPLSWIKFLSHQRL